jgi:pyruvate/2-oxoglutarate dehydrogenase complex dihydrolipoamide dehydrogenase (E3) component
MCDALGVSSNAANCLLSHGQVKLDERTLMNDERTWAIGDLYGKLLTAGRMQARLYGSRTIEDHDPACLPRLVESNAQLTLGDHLWS